MKISKEEFFINHEEPEYSQNEILRIKEKYGISEEDLEKLMFNLEINKICRLED